MIFEATSEYKGTSNKNLSQVEDLQDQRGKARSKQVDAHLGVKATSNVEDLSSNKFSSNNGREVLYQYSDQISAKNNQIGEEDLAADKKSLRERLSLEPSEKHRGSLEDRRLSKQSQPVLNSETHINKLTPRESRKRSSASKHGPEDQQDPPASHRSKGSAADKAKLLIEALTNQRKAVVELNLQATPE